MGNFVSINFHSGLQVHQIISNVAWLRYYMVFQDLFVMWTMCWYQGRTKKNMIAVSTQFCKRFKQLDSLLCQFSCPRIVFLGHVIDANGISPDSHKTEAIQKIKPPTTVSELRRFMGMIKCSVNWKMKCPHSVLLQEGWIFFLEPRVFIIIIRLYSIQHWRSDSNMCCSLWIILTY